MTKTLRSFALGAWHEASSRFVPLVDPSTEAVLAQASSDGLDFAAMLDYGRREGGSALRELSFAQRGELLKAMSKTLRDHRDELLDLSRRNNGTTLADGSFDIDGAAGTLAYYAGLARGLGERRVQLDGEGIQLAKTEAFWAQHAYGPRHGVAIHINAFNFPAWGFAEKAACALLAGMPLITKPATATAWVTERCVELVAGLLPPGALQLICGNVGDLFDHLDPQDVVAFTGSADTAQRLRGHARVLGANPRFNVEADSVNAAVLGPDLQPDSELFEFFLRDVVREITQKAGQKCTAVRRILVPRPLMAATRDFLVAKLAGIQTGDPALPETKMGPLATAAQLHSAVEGVALLAREGRILLGGQRVDGVGVAPGRGYFFAPTLFEITEPATASQVHHHEVFGPVASLLPYDGLAVSAAHLVARSQGTLVTSAYSDDPAWSARFFAAAAPFTGRFYLGSSAAASAALGSGAALPQTLHGGPGRAGGGEELGGLAGLRLYQQKTALQGARSAVDAILE